MGRKKYLGVYRRVDGGWYSTIRDGYENRYLGSFSDPESAARAYDDAARAMGKRLNFEGSVNDFRKVEERLATEGDYALESHACAALDERLAKLSDYFYVEREVTGWWIQPRAAIVTEGDKYTRPRLDRVLHPTRKAIEAGWKDGPFGIEIKRSAVKAGSAISQALDYHRAVFDAPGGGLNLLKWIFLFPMGPSEGDLGVLQAQMRIGYVSLSGSFLRFGAGRFLFMNFIEAGGRIHPRFEDTPDYAYKVGGRTAKPVSESK